MLSRNRQMHITNKQGRVRKRDQVCHLYKFSLYSQGTVLGQIQWLQTIAEQQKQP